jgi:hypothetical protein
MDKCEELPGIDRFSLAFEFGLKRIGKRQIHVVAAQQNNARERASFTARCCSRSLRAASLSTMCWGR